LYLPDTMISLYPSHGQALYELLLTIFLSRGIILVACEVELLSLSSQRHFPGLTCPGRRSSVDLGLEETDHRRLDNRWFFLYTFPQMLDRRINTLSRNKSRACLAARGFVV